MTLGQDSLFLHCWTVSSQFITCASHCYVVNVSHSYEFSNKGADLFLESLGRLNHFLQVSNDSVYIVSTEVSIHTCDSYCVCGNFQGISL